jgi:glycosyltransferase involved in cell wall biosynthesis
LNQTYRNIELIIVDDGSKDATTCIIESYNDERIKYVRHKKNLGLPAALNTGFAHTTGEYLTWTSNDNRYLPTAIEEMANYLLANHEVDFVYADYWAHNLETDDRELRILPDKLVLEKRNDVGACFLYHRRVYEEIGNFNPTFRLVEDYDYWMRICSKFNAKHLPKPLYVYGEHSKSLKSTRQVGIRLFENILKYQKKYVARTEFTRSLLNLFNSIGKPTSPKELFRFLQNIISVSRVSLQLSFFCIVLLSRSSMTVVARFGVKRLYMQPKNYIGFFLFFKPKYSQLVPNAGKKNILFIVPSLVVGGAEKVVLNIAKSTDKTRYSFHVIATEPATHLWRSKFEEYFGSVVTPLKNNDNPYYYDKIIYKYLQCLIRKLVIDIVIITNSELGYKYLPRLRSEFRDVKFIDLLHAENFPPIPQLAQLAVYLDRRICISQRLRNHLLRKYKILNIQRYASRLHVIHNGVDTSRFKAENLEKGNFKSRFSIPEESKIISFIGRFTSEDKNPLLFVEIAKNVLSIPESHTKFIMAGNGPEFDTVKNRIKHEGFQDRITLVGMIENVDELLNDTFLLLIVSRKEGIPLTILEAMSMGVPVISTDVGAIGEVIENKSNGLLIDIQNPTQEIIEDFAKKILGLLSNQTSYNILAQRAKETIISQFTLESMGSQYQNIFDELTTNRPLL